MPGARFVRADLHVHVDSDGGAPAGDPDAYVREAVARDVGVLGITDHNHTDHVRAVVEAGHGTDLLVLPGIEVTTHQGHLLALFSPDDYDSLSDVQRSLDLRSDPTDGSRRSTRSLLQLVGDIHSAGGLAILAHVDRDEGLHARVSRTELVELLSHEGLAGLEFVGQDSLKRWYSDQDDAHAAGTLRRDAWRARQANPELKVRGLARVMSSDAHDASLLGTDGTSRPLTKLRLDHLNFQAVKNALLHNPKGRVKAEVLLPVSYPRVLSAAFRGGFLDGVQIEFSSNLNCLIGGRGSGKSTALLGIRTALGARPESGEDPDAAGRMPDVTVVRFVDAFGTERVAIRERGQAPFDEDGEPLSLPLADLAQDESGVVARDYLTNPTRLLSFLDSFCEVAPAQRRERDLLDQLNQNGRTVRETAFSSDDLAKLKTEQDQLEAQFKAAQGGRLEELADWARRLATQAALIARVRERVADLLAPRRSTRIPTLAELAAETRTDLTVQPVGPLVESVETALRAINDRLASLEVTQTASMREVAGELDRVLDTWQSDHAALQARLNTKQAELEAQGLRVEAGEIRRLAKRLEDVAKMLSDLRGRRRSHLLALQRRNQLLGELRGNWAELHGLRRSTLRNISARANDGSLGLRVQVSFKREGQREPWIEWLRGKFGFRSPRVERLAEAMTPSEFCEAWLGDRSALLAKLDTNGDGTAFFSAAQLEARLSWDQVFEVETMRLEDRPRIVVEEGGRPPREFDELSAGQQRSVLLSLLLCAGGSDPLIVDQPEDHLDAPYVASAVVQHLEAAKETRQLIIATHSAMWRQFMGLSQDGKLGPRGDHLPFLQAMAMVHEFPDVMAMAGPPVFLQHALAALLAPIARLGGYRGKYEEYLHRGPTEIVELEPLPALQQKQWIA